MTYYIDSIYGSDKADGTTRQTAWRTLDAVNSRTFKGGDVILFKAGCTFEGNLTPKRENDGGVIRIGRYGVGANPEIVGTDAVVYLHNFPNVELFGLSVTGKDAIRGIFVKYDLKGACKYTYIHDCCVHDINEGRITFHHESGGIICVARCEAEDEKGWFEDLRIEDNEVLNVARSGIFTVCEGRLSGRREDGTRGHIDDADWRPAIGEVIRGNYIDRTGGDGIVILGAKSPLMEWNTVYRCMTNPCTPAANAGIWPQSTTACVIQYNEVGYIHKPQNTMDAQGYDVDAACSDTIIQYNYSHDNEGGFLLLCEVDHSNDDSHFRGTIVRNNLSVNDGNTKGELIGMVGPVRGALLENNTIVAAGRVNRITEVWTPDGQDQAADITYRNNIFICNGKGNWENTCNAANFVMDNNLYWGAYRDIPEKATDAKVFDPRLTKVGESGNGLLAAANYVPLSDSEALTAGKAAQAPSSVDFFGNPVDGKAYVGAFVAGPRE